MYCFADTIVELFVTSSSTTSSDEVTPRFLSSTMAASPEGTERQASMKMDVGLRRAVAWTVEKPIPRLAPVMRVT